MKVAQEILQRLGEKVRSMKRCSKCRVFKPKSEFFSDRSKPDGLRGTCKSCFSLTVKEYRKSHRKGLAAYYRRYYAGHRDAVKRSKLKWAKRNPDCVRAINRKWAKKWASQNPDLKTGRDVRIWLSQGTPFPSAFWPAALVQAVVRIRKLQRTYAKTKIHLPG